MAISLNTGNGIEVTAAADGSLYRNMFGNDFLVLETGNQFKAEIISNTSIQISDGDALLCGRHMWTKPNDSTIVTIETGEQGKKRVDHIVVKYTNDSGAEKVEFEVVKGNTVASSEEYDDHYSWLNDVILQGGKQYKAVLYSVYINGLNIEKVKKEFYVVQSLKTLQERIVALEIRVNNLELGVE